MSFGLKRIAFSEMSVFVQNCTQILEREHISQLRIPGEVQRVVVEVVWADIARVRH